MFITALDYISPSITFYHKGNLSHTSIFSGILSIIAIVFVFILGVNYSLEIIQRTDPNTYYFNSFIEDAGTIQINSSSLFHFIIPVKNIRGKYIYDQFDFTIFNIIGTSVYYSNFYQTLRTRPLKKMKHWVYGLCDKEDGDEVKDLLNYTIFEKSACIKKFCNGTTQKCYDKGDPNFVWPEIAHGSFNENNILYNFIIQKCDNTLIKELLGEDAQCKSDEEINQYFQQNVQLLYLYFINNYINVLDYDNPSNKFFYRIENILVNDQYTENDLNINPALIKSNVGLFFDSIKEDYSYSFDRNDVYTGTYDGVYTVYGFFLKNMMVYYERTYKKIQDVVSDIGGIHQVVTIIAVCLNSIYNEYVILSDTSLLLDSSIENEKKINKDKQSQNINNKLDSNKNTGVLEIRKYSQKNLNEDNRNERRKKIISMRKKSSKNTHIVSSNIISTNIVSNNIMSTQGCELIEHKDEMKSEVIGNIEGEENNKENTKKGNFFEYLLFLLSCKKKKTFFQTYENFRVKMISEEHLIRNHLNIYNLMKATETDGNKRRNSYQYNDLINLI